MTRLKEIKELHTLVVKLLTKYPHLRDSDQKLVSNIWYYELDGAELSAKDFIGLIANKKLTNYDSITRARRKVQEEHEELRGTNYTKRKEQEAVVREGINNKLSLF